MDKILSFVHRKLASFAAILICTMVLAGCTTPTQQIATFASACNSIGSDSQKAYELLDDSIQKKAVYDLALSPARIDGNSAIFSEVMKERDRLAIRTKMLSELADYAQALQQLANKNFRAGIDASSKDLAGALKSLKDDYEKEPGKKLSLSDTDVYVLSTIVDAAGSAYVEWKRREDIKAIVQKADPAVQQVTALLTNEFRDIGANVGIQLNDLETDYMKGFDNGANNLSFDARVQMLENIQVAHGNYLNSTNFYATLVTAAAKIGQTHATINNALHQNNWTSKKLFDQVQDLAAWAKTVKLFYQSLKK